MKLCRCCNRTKDPTEFYRRRNGLQSKCKECTKANVRQWQENNRDRYLETMLAYRERNREYWARHYQANRTRSKENVMRARAADPHRYASYSAAYRARKRTQQVDAVDRFEIFERDKWVCQICNQPVDPMATGRHPEAPSLDHIVPLSLGGAHSAENTQLAHLGCNSRKGARV